MVDEGARRHGWGSTRWYETSPTDSGREAAQAARADGADVILIAGGDGTVRAVADVVRGTGIPVALLPFGTGNLLARNLGAPRNDLTASVAAAFSGSSRAVDVGVAELRDETGSAHTHAFVVMAGMGLDADMAKTTSALAKKHLGWLAYVSPIATSICKNRRFLLRFRVDHGPVMTARAHTVIVGNCGTLTGNMLLLPAARVDDGKLDVVMMRPAGRLGWTRIGSRLTLQGWARRSRLSRTLLSYAGDLRALAYTQGSVFEAAFDEPREIQLDGDGFGAVTRVKISVLPGALLIRST
ncbi:MAG: transcriptional regulator [Microbacterium sp.]|nr:MAG: transcriptional regulator [Microbacterium sp.]